MTQKDNIDSTAVSQKWIKEFVPNSDHKDGKCPKCGYCPHCGRGPNYWPDWTWRPQYQPYWWQQSPPYWWQQPLVTYTDTSTSSNEIVSWTA